MLRWTGVNILTGLLIKNNDIQEIVCKKSTQKASSVSEFGLNDKILKLKPDISDVIDEILKDLGRYAVYYACGRKEINLWSES